MQLTPEQLAMLETPCIVIDVETAKKNIQEMQKRADAYGVALRPHIKTHKMPFFAKLQIEAGAAGITCAKVSEAEVMAEAGLKDIFIAYPMVGDFRIKRALALLPKLERLILAVDSLEGATALNDAAKAAGVIVEVRLEVDTGAKRTGIPREKASALAKEIAVLENLSLTGIYTFKSLLYEGKPTDDNTLAGEEEGRMMREIREEFAAQGVVLKDISAGSTPTGLTVAATGHVTEIRPGTYIFKDTMLIHENVGQTNELAAKLYATVVSTPAPDYAVLDGGTKTFPTDVPLFTPPFSFTGYATVEGRGDLRLSRMNEEHGIITAENGETGLKVGEKLALLPNHVCTAVNMQNRVYLLEDGELRTQTVDARGMLV